MSMDDERQKASLGVKSKNKTNNNWNNKKAATKTNTRIADAFQHCIIKSFGAQHK